MASKRCASEDAEWCKRVKVEVSGVEEMAGSPGDSCPVEDCADDVGPGGVSSVDPGNNERAVEFDFEVDEELEASLVGINLSDEPSGDAQAVVDGCRGACSSMADLQNVLENNIQKLEKMRVNLLTKINKSRTAINAVDNIPDSVVKSEESFKELADVNHICGGHDVEMLPMSYDLRKQSGVVGHSFGSVVSGAVRKMEKIFKENSFENVNVGNVKKAIEDLLKELKLVLSDLV
ncbi:hypothetical protein ONE63_011556 [Megalurothrips usitatus]|uniref:Uncharacterized protein n=1 Tax=Megalurothrips usitatus TaxID=439358 RepID=A0AAV7WZ02_9NEOP|nr:hypothetical protein ONE63_011556 [Megalurothrips usitatus]